jgi:hypothetical protein
MRFPWRRCRDERQRFVQKRAQENRPSDGACVQANDANQSERQKIVLAVREVVASSCGVAPELIRWDDSPRQLEAMMGPVSLREFIVAIPMAIPEGVDSTEFGDVLEAKIKSIVGASFSLEGAIGNDLVARWRASSTLGVFAEWLADAARLPSRR